MRANVILFWILAGFFFVATAGYTVWSVIFSSQRLAPSSSSGPGTPIEWVGTITLGLCGVLAAFIAFYLGRVRNAQGGELPEDNVNANIDDGDPESGFFSPFSWWPILVAASLGLIFLGLAVGFWVSIIGVGLGVVTLVGWTFEYYRGYFAR
ncbi:cytochrome c oxidase subunit 4 [Cryobacterium sp. SO1]|uniref:cytochrome c oxidase subunit 4 n=1 Tax=Cryobacterium sp. SO1 TaxID=1897061 RepID=UPI001023BD64|nr:cytochrome c oxidase subunit 4 [Cryobacterium sp. SO1]RZI36666.1 Cytochrome c oxidase polypeptide 4 [Cryobacterium sp. SO1]